MSSDLPKLIIDLNRLTQWLRDDALPFWVSHGFDAKTGAGYEALSSSGDALPAQVRLMQNQAKLIYVLARAECVGWGSGYQTLIKNGFEFVSRYGVAANRSDGYIHSLNADYSVREQHYELADHAHFALASIAAYSAYGNSGDIRRAINIIDWLEFHFKEGNHWHEFTHGAKPVGLNSTLLIFEVFLHFYEANKKERWHVALHASFDKLKQDWQKLVPQLEAKQLATAQLGEVLQAIWLLCRFYKLGGTVTLDELNTAYGALEKMVLAKLQAEPTHRKSEELFFLQMRALKANLALASVHGGVSLNMAQGSLAAIKKSTLVQNLPDNFATNTECRTASGLFEIMQASLAARNFIASLRKP